MLHIDPETCIDCGACADECPVDAIQLDDDLAEDQRAYLDLNAQYYEALPMTCTSAVDNPKPWRTDDFSDLRVAVVGSGPAGFYAAKDLQTLRVAQVEVFDRLLTPYGLARFGVAPDHQATKGVTAMFQSLGKKKNLHVNLGIDVGQHISHAELLEHHDAVIYAVGASLDRQLGIEGEDLVGSHAANEFVAWYNGHPEYANHQFDLSGERAVIIGNGNVALDIARMLLANTDHLEKTDMAQHALDALQNSNIREVVVVGRRGPAQAAYTNPEILALLSHEGIDVIIDQTEAATDDITQTILDDRRTESSVRAKVRSAQEAATRIASGARKRLVLRYLHSPVKFDGREGRLDSVTLVRNRLELLEDGTVVAVRTSTTEEMKANIVFRSVGYRGSSVSDVPFDDHQGIIPNLDGKVIDPHTGEPLPGVYVTGWIKRGPTGVIGTNKQCAGQTVDQLLQDHLRGDLTAPIHPAGSVRTLIAERCPDAIGFDEWGRVDTAEQAAGAALSRPRVKFVDTESILVAARGLHDR